MTRRLIGVALALGLGLGSSRADEFWAAWGDGKGELSSYTLTQPRYGAPRDGVAVLIFVTEDFADDLRVKADPGKHPAADVYPVLKLNVVRDFQTGIYDYNLLTSTFVRTEAAGGAPFALVKTSFSAQEWCGHVYQHWIARDGKLTGVAHSYFDGEADQARELPAPAGGIVEEQLPILVRGLRGDWLKPGESRAVPLLRSAMRSRLGHSPPAWSQATVARAGAPVEIASALGKRPAIVYTVADTGPGGVTTTWFVEQDAPHRLLAWHGSDGEDARIRGSARLPYWQLNRPGDERNLPLIGLPLPGKLPPPPPLRGNPPDARSPAGRSHAPIRDLADPFSAH
jgi:hypothetical protein